MSKRLSLALRHEPASLGIVLDEGGFASVDAVLVGFAAQGEVMTYDDLVLVVETSDKQRFAFSEDRARIRANQGHSVDVDLGLVASEPPETLFHGTVRRVVEAIRREGLDRRGRAHVHLSADVRTAAIVAHRRRPDEPGADEGAQGHVILRVRARAMHAAGHAFFLSENGVWLTAHVPPAYLEEG